jgi:hypothetical protein
MSIVWIYYGLFVHPPIGGHLDDFQFLTVMNKSYKHFAQVLVRVFFQKNSFGKVSRSVIAGSYGMAMLPLEETAKLFSKVAAAFCILTSNQ